MTSSPPRDLCIDPSQVGEGLGTGLGPSRRQSHSARSQILESRTERAHHIISPSSGEDKCTCHTLSDRAGVLGRDARECMKRIVHSASLGDGDAIRGRDVRAGS